MNWQKEIRTFSIIIAHAQSTVCFLLIQRCLNCFQTLCVRSNFQNDHYGPNLLNYCKFIFLFQITPVKGLTICTKSLIQLFSYLKIYEAILIILTVYLSWVLLFNRSRTSVVLLFRGKLREMARIKNSHKIELYAHMWEVT